PYHAGLAGRHLQRLPVTPAFPTCSFPLRLSPSGQSDDPGAFLRAPPDCVRDSTPRSAAHTFASSGSPVALSFDWMARSVSAVCISHPSTFQPSGHLPPFARCPAFPDSNYYGGSVALGLAP